MLDRKIEDKVKEWLTDNYIKEIRDEVSKLLVKNNVKELTDRFYKDLDFGTGGLRGIIGAGTNRINIYTVGKAAQGLANYLNKNEPGAKERGVVIAYDSRNMSDVFALRSALIFAANGITSYLFQSLRPVPVLSFSIRHLKAITGIVVTASHNPPEYNGYKVSWADGAQVLAPHDKGIIEEARNIKSVKEIKLISEEEALDKGLLKYIGDEIDEVYYKKVLNLALNKDIVSNMSTQPKIIYSPLHGAGNIPVRECLKRWGFQHVEVVKEQELPDGNFPTVKYPNPEESDALAMAINQGKAANADLVLATDPDADRVGIAVNNGGNDFVLLNGNQVGVILSYYLLSEYSKKKKLPKKPLLIKTIVSTDLINPICEDFQIDLEETLTGFKYIAQRIYHYHENNNRSKEFIFGFEESYGYLAGDFVRDKDAVSACCLIAEVAAVCKKESKTLLDYLDEIYQKYGYYLESLKSLTLKGLEGVQQIQDLMDFFRHNPLRTIADNAVIKIRDIEQGTILDLVKNTKEKIELPKSNVITYYLDNGGKITMRPSGTEPKIKFYFSVSQKNGRELSSIKTNVQNQLEQLENNFMNIVSQLLLPN